MSQISSVHLFVGLLYSLPYLTFVGDVIHSHTNTTVIHRMWSEVSWMSTVQCWADTDMCGDVRVPCVLRGKVVDVDVSDFQTYWRPSNDALVKQFVPCQFNEGDWVDRLAVISIYACFYYSSVIVLAQVMKRVNELIVKD